MGAGRPRPDPAWTHRRAEQATEEVRAARTELDTIAAGQARVREELARARMHAENLSEQLQRAQTWRRALAASELLCEVQELDEAVPEEPRLPTRLDAAAAAEQHRLLELAVDGAEDERALEGLERRGLLPPPRDVERTLAALAAEGVTGHYGHASLSRNATGEAAAERLALDPSRYSGVLVLDAVDLGRVLAEFGETRSRAFPWTNAGGHVPAGSVPLARRGSSRSELPRALLDRLAGPAMPTQPSCQAAGAMFGGVGGSWGVSDLARVSDTWHFWNRRSAPGRAWSSMDGQRPRTSRMVR